MLLRVLANGFRIHGPQHGTMGHVLYDDLGLELPPSLPADLSTEFVPMEQLLEIDPDYLFFMKGNEEREKELRDGPIWNQLSAVKNGRVYEVDIYWIRGHGVFGKSAVVDDTVNLLVEE
jgi:iron complex transport system substrate-binding protein